LSVISRSPELKLVSRVLNVRSAGFTLMEMLVSVAIMAVLLGFAVPAYQRYVTTAQEGVLRNNIQSMHIFQEDYFLRTGRYANNLADLAAIEAAIGWRPRNQDGITYAVASGGGAFYDVTAVDPDGLTLCVRLPQRVDC